MARVRRSGRRGRRFESAISDLDNTDIILRNLGFLKNFASIVQRIERRFPKP